MQRPLSSLGQGLALCLALEGQWQVLLASSSWADVTSSSLDSDAAFQLTDSIRIAGGDALAAAIAAAAAAAAASFCMHCSICTAAGGFV